MKHQILTKEIIIKTSIEIIEKDEKLTFTTIAKKIGIRSQSLYTYFENINELKYAIVAWGIQTIKKQIQDQLFGQSGIEAIINFSKELRHIALQHSKLSQFILLSTRPTDYPAANDAFKELRNLLYKLLESTFQNESVRIMVSRCLRDLIIGDIINIGTGWFTDETIPPEESFDKFIQQNLATFQEMDQKSKN
ncbi:MAG: TetR/AcrR family transcriptional regulator [Liquorilactobacillus ghanensis]|uniref:TetR/AcrR family transcriptional regulator n=2 Tax=Lactobacillaceae TaxID=33958 RepID=UPI0039E91A1A